jgi:hypothetical protein
MRGTGSERVLKSGLKLARHERLVSCKQHEIDQILWPGTRRCVGAVSSSVGVHLLGDVHRGWKSGHPYRRHIGEIKQVRPFHSIWSGIRWRETDVHLYLLKLTSRHARPHSISETCTARVVVVLGKLYSADVELEVVIQVNICRTAEISVGLVHSAFPRQIHVFCGAGACNCPLRQPEIESQPTLQDPLVRPSSKEAGE